jgi:hypothetical protein
MTPMKSTPMLVMFERKLAGKVKGKLLFVEGNRRSHCDPSKENGRSLSCNNHVYEGGSP